MKRRMLTAALARAEQHVAQGKRHLAEQRVRIARLDAAGHDSALARDLLNTFEASQAIYIADRDRLAKELAALT